MAFLEDQVFPKEIAAWLVGGRSFNTAVGRNEGGYDYRTPLWDLPLGEWEASQAFRLAQTLGGFGVKDLISLFMNAQGRAHGFRVRAPNDNSDDGHGVLGTTGLGVASTLIYQMYKNYVTGSHSFQIPVLKPETTGIKIYKNDILQTSGYTLDTTTGLVTFGSQPTVGQSVTWTGPYHIPVRFDSDKPDIGRAPAGTHYDWPGLRLMELRSP